MRRTVLSFLWNAEYEEFRVFVWEGSLHTALSHLLCDWRQASEGPETPRWLLLVALRRIPVFFVAAASRLLPVIIGGCFPCHCSGSVL